jgi:CheY-like chemotaxis protein
MPGMHGLDAASELKRIMPEIPIVLFTVHAETFRNINGRLPIDLVVSKSEFDLMSHVRRLVPV